MRQGCLKSHSVINTVLEVLAGPIRKGKEIKGMEIGREVKHPFLDDMRLSIRDANNSTRELLEMINSAISRMQNQYTQINTFSIHQQQAHIRRAHGHATIHRSLQEKTKNKPNQGGKVPLRKHMLCSWTARMQSVAMTILSKAIYRFNVIPIPISTSVIT